MFSSLPQRPCRLIAQKPRLCLILLCLALWLPGFTTLPAGDRDESRFAQATKQMLETGDFVRIQNGAVPRLKKPIGIYWLQTPFAAAAHGLGIAEQNPIWPYRMPSLLGSLLAVLATFSLGQTIGLTRQKSFLAAAFLAACALLVTETHIAKTDAAQLGAITTCLAILAQAAFATPSFAAAMIFWGALGLGVLIKGPVAPMVVGISFAAHSLIRRDLSWGRKLYPKTGLALLCALVLPWFIAIGISTHGDFFAQSVGNDLAKKLAQGEESHGGFFGLHAILLPFLAFPASFFVLRGLWDAIASRHQPATAFLLAILLPNWLIFEAVPTKLPHYTLPLYPVLMLLAADSAFNGQKSPRVLHWLGAVPLAVTAAMLSVGAVLLPGFLGDSSLWGLATLPAAALVFYWGREQPLRAIAAAIPIYIVVFGLVLPATGALWLAPQLRTALAGFAPGRSPLAGDVMEIGFAEPSAMFLLGTNLQSSDNPDDAAFNLQNHRVKVAIIAGSKIASFQADCARRHVRLTRGPTINGFNYSLGHRISLVLFGPAL